MRDITQGILVSLDMVLYLVPVILNISFCLIQSMPNFYPPLKKMIFKKLTIFLINRYIESSVYSSVTIFYFPPGPWPVQQASSSKPKQASWLR